MDVGTAARRTGAYDLVEPAYSAWQRRRWVLAGRPVPAPSAVKRQVLREYGRTHGLTVLVETGTYKADTVRALRRDFDLIHSIEINETLYERAAARCRQQPNAQIHLGDSAQIVGTILMGLSEPALFWLDAHYSGADTGGEGDQPILNEVEQVLATNAGHVLLIDDVREFGTDPNYPLLTAIEDLAAAQGYSLGIKDDIARLTPEPS